MRMWGVEQPILFGILWNKFSMTNLTCTMKAVFLSLSFSLITLTMYTSHLSASRRVTLSRWNGNITAAPKQRISKFRKEPKYPEYLFIQPAHIASASVSEVLLRDIPWTSDPSNAVSPSIGYLDRSTVG